ncbi:hypothetical protein KFE25_013062 [Diacronema lutheri]|uniref:riboflavin kinase n=1 Tax=Diacronema lutheri TaxID=2081491 RepID=A0A8J6C5Q3_DIALT|nr:hypothetical protein KFE25_013062 [Diacronema lutheri]
MLRLLPRGVLCLAALGCTGARGARLARVRPPRAPCRASAAASAGGAPPPPDETAAAHADRVVRLHRDLAAAAVGGEGGAGVARAAHNARQAAVFDAAVDWFASAAATPPDVEPRLRRIAAAALPADGARAAPPPRVLDVGCGAGALVPFLRERAPALDLLGLDLSAKMAAACAARHGARVLCADVVDWADAEAAAGRGGAFDAVVFNACFGNMHSPRLALRAACTAARPSGGRVVIAHPLGRAFVSRLRAEDAAVVPHELPADARALAELAEGLPLRLVALDDEAPADGAGGGGDGFYCALLERWLPRPLPRVMLLRGEVSRGYGRGSAQLGVPTANLREQDFAGELAHVPTGVYAGWAVIEGAAGRAGEVVHRAVVNVGYSPTFAGAENAQKIVEAHLLPGGPSGRENGGGALFAPASFYGAQMRLLLCAFVRPEHKFESFPLLLAAIHKDVDEAARVLSEDELAPFARDPFLLMGLAPDGTVGLRAGRGSGASGPVRALFKTVDFALARSAAAMQKSTP